VSRFDLRAPSSIVDADRYDVAAFTSWSGAIADSMQLAAGGRVDRITTRNRDGYFGDRSTSDVALSGYGAVTAGPLRRVTATLQLASGYREPTLSDRYFRGISGRGFITGNPELQPERSLQLDGALRWNGTRSRVALFAYEYRIRDLVERYRQGTDFFFRNRGEAAIRGLEAELTTRLPRSLELRLGATVSRGEDVDTGDALADIAPPTLHASLRWAAARASAFVATSAFADDDRPGVAEVARPGHVEVDLGAGWRIAPALELRVVIRNAANAFHFGSTDEVAAFAPGRSVMIGINR
jgi:outer membrane receptor protein involved in Fe transport